MLTRPDLVFTPVRRCGDGRRRVPVVLAVIVLGVCGSGCASMWTPWRWGLWVADYDTAERQARDSGRGMLIHYKDTTTGADGSLERTLNSAPVKGRTHDFVRCVLFKSYEPDRRYVAQFGVERAPALIVVHRDGTYHARSGPMSADDVTTFLAEAKAPGQEPVINPHIPRKPAYHWQSSYEKAEALGRGSGRPVVVVFYRTLSRDWARIEPLLDRHEVYVRLSSMVQCRIGLTRLFGDATITRFGALKLPAIVIVRADGAYHTLELPRSYDAIARFVDEAQASCGDSQAAAPTDATQR